ncbi:MAG: hypothetical protein ACREAF_05640 [Nitrosopumilaceae archaeon]
MKTGHKRGRNWFTAMGVLFIVMACIILVRNLLIWGPEFVADFFISGELTNEKFSAAMIGFGGFLLYLGFRKRINEEN